MTHYQSSTTRVQTDSMLAAELAEEFVGGRRIHVIEKLRSLTVNQALIVMFHLSKMLEPKEEYTFSTMIRQE